MPPKTTVVCPTCPTEKLLRAPQLLFTERSVMLTARGKERREAEEEKEKEEEEEEEEERRTQRRMVRGKEEGEEV
jgi:hypothetical protein